MNGNSRLRYFAQSLLLCQALSVSLPASGDAPQPKGGGKKLSSPASDERSTTGGSTGMSQILAPQNPPAATADTGDASDLVPVDPTISVENPPDPTLSAVNPVADNSMMNRLHDGKIGLTAQQQSNRREDVDITRSIRKKIVKNKDLSIYAHNVKIITRDGEVTLKGPVRSLNEKQKVEDSAIEVAGPDRVRSELEVTAR